MSGIIHAWVYDPTQALFGKKSQKAACLTVTCENPQGCDLYKKLGTCALLGSSISCPSGKKTRQEGPTQRARSFRGWIQEKGDWCKKVSHDLKPFKASQRIFYANGWYCLPYPAMSDAFLLSSAPVRNSWIQESELTAEVLLRICTAAPRNIFGDNLIKYQREVVPKFIMDLKAHYPILYEMLPTEQQQRVEVFDYRGRQALLSTMAPGPVTLGQDIWYWNGRELSRETGTFLPVKGRISSTVVPDPNVTVKITDNSQVMAETEFVD